MTPMVRLTALGIRHVPDNTRRRYDEAIVTDPDIVVYRIFSGAFFFGAAASIGAVLDRIPNTHRALVIDFSAVPFLDSTAAKTIEGLMQKATRKSVLVHFTGTSHNLRKDLFAHRIKPPLVRYDTSIRPAVEKARKRLS